MPLPRSDRGLTPDQHQTIRRVLALIPAFIWLAYVWPIFFAQLPEASHPERGHYIRDFLHFYSLGVVVREQNRAALYDIDALADTAERAAPDVPKQLYPTVYGPQVGFLFLPLTALPYIDALYAWLVITLVGYGACVYLVTRENDSLRQMPWTVAALALGLPGLHLTLSFAQASVVGLVCFTTIWIALRRGWLFSAGLAVGALAYKPPLALVAAVVFVARREWRIVAGAFTAVLVQLVVAAAYWGPDVFREYVAALMRLPDYIDVMEPHPELAQTIRASMSHVALSPAASALTAIVLSAVIATAAVWCWRPRRSLELSYVALVSATLLVDPHFYAYDLLVAAPALMLAWQVAHAGARWVGIAAFAVYAAPIISMADIVRGVPWTLVALAGLLTAVIAAQRGTSIPLHKSSDEIS